MEQVSSCYKPTRWYSNPSFSLVPNFKKHKSDKYNTPGFSFNWLFLSVWTLDSFDFEVSVVANSHFGVGVTAILPYLRFLCCIPLPVKTSLWIEKNLWRKSESEKESFDA